MDRKQGGAVKVSALAINVIPELVDVPVPTGFVGAKRGTRDMLPLLGLRTSKDELSANEGIVFNPTGDVTSGVASSADLAGDVTVSVASSADLAGVITVGVASSADLAGDVTVGVGPRPTLLEISPSVWRPRAYLAGDVAVGVASSVNLAGDVTVGVASSADLAGVVTIGVVPSADLAGEKRQKRLYDQRAVKRIFVKG